MRATPQHGHRRGHRSPLPDDSLDASVVHVRVMALERGEGRRWSDDAEGAFYGFGQLELLQSRGARARLFRAGVWRIKRCLERYELWSGIEYTRSYQAEVYAVSL